MVLTFRQDEEDEDVCAVLDSFGINSSDVCGNGVCSSKGCVCEDGYLASSEFLFYRADDFEFDFDEDVKSEIEKLSPCRKIAWLHFTLYGTALVFTFGSLMAYALSVRKRSQLKRLVPSFVVLTIFGILPVIKIADSTQEIGEDYGVTILFGLTLWFISLSMHQFLNKYISYQYKTFKIKERKNEKAVKGIEFGLKVNTALGFLYTIIFVASAAVSRINLNLTGLLFRTATFLSGMSILFVACAAFFLLSLLVKDVHLVQISGDKKKKVIGKIERVKYVSFIAMTLSGIGGIAGAISKEVLEYLTYYVPLLIILFCAASVVALYYNRKARKSTGRKSTLKPGFSFRLHKRSSFEARKSSLIEVEGPRKSSFAVVQQGFHSSRRKSTLSPKPANRKSRISTTVPRKASLNGEPVMSGV